ncbi:hypothetical protein C8R44DRAFT_880046 [Mycena epipterygia]|nr:hypothetical protein C8R44DRAFT_880046 [Mycena epipterygia]
MYMAVRDHPLPQLTYSLDRDFNMYLAFASPALSTPDSSSTFSALGDSWAVLHESPQNCTGPTATRRGEPPAGVWLPRGVGSSAIFHRNLGFHLHAVVHPRVAYLQVLPRSRDVRYPPVRIEDAAGTSSPCVLLSEVVGWNPCQARSFANSFDLAGLG